MRIKTNVKTGENGAGAGSKVNHNQMVARGMKVKTTVRAGGTTMQHNQTVAPGLKVKSNVKAGKVEPRDIPLTTPVNKPSPSL